MVPPPPRRRVCVEMNQSIGKVPDQKQRLTRCRRATGLGDRALNAPILHAIVVDGGVGCNQPLGLVACVRVEDNG